MEMGIRALVSALVLALLAFGAIALPASASPPTSCVQVLGLTETGGSDLEIELSEFIPSREPEELRLIIVPPEENHPGTPGTPDLWQVKTDEFHIYKDLFWVWLDHNASSAYMQRGDKLVIDLLSGRELPTGVWQAFVIDTTSYPSIGITFVLGQYAPGTHGIPYAAADVADPMVEYGFLVRKDNALGVAIMVTAEAGLLGLMMLVIRQKE